MPSIVQNGRALSIVPLLTFDLTGEEQLATGEWWSGVHVFNHVQVMVVIETATGADVNDTIETYIDTYPHGAPATDIDAPPDHNVDNQGDPFRWGRFANVAGNATFPNHQLANASRGGADSSGSPTSSGQGVNDLLENTAFQDAPLLTTGEFKIGVSASTDWFPFGSIRARAVTTTGNDAASRFTGRFYLFGTSSLPAR